MNVNDKFEIVFKEELRGRNALHFWAGLGSIILGLYLWWNGWFSAFMVETNLAPEALETSFESRAPRGVGSSTGFLSLTFDTFCLIGWGVVSVLGLMRGFLSGLMERLQFTSNGLYAWANNRQTESSVPTLEVKVEEIARNHEQRIGDVESKTEDMPLPEPPPQPPTLEERLSKQAEQIQELEAALIAKSIGLGDK